MKIYNSLTNKIENFIPIEKNKIKMYVCGPTVYNYIHIGNARPVVFFDTVRRYFKFIGYDITFVTNLTDLNDKIYLKSLEEGTDELAIAEKYSKAFLEDVVALNSLLPDLTPSVLGYIKEITKYVEKLIEVEAAYEVDGDVYFRVSKLKEYGQLSGQKIEDLISGVRIDINDKKENPLDFMLWKKNEKGIKFKSSFGEGRPGWHTECSAMIDDIFGGEVDIHGGGNDLRFPHHENELAQTYALHNRGLAKTWMHNGRIDLNNTKMSKSSGNMILVRELLEKYDANAYRLLILSANYRSPINFTDELMEQYQKEYLKILRVKKSLFIILDLADEFSEEVEGKYIAQLKKAMDHDFGTANAITYLQSLIKEINAKMRDKVNSKDLAVLYNTLEKYLYVLGIEIELKKMSAEDRKIYFLWEKARQEKNFDLADNYRKHLLNKGII